jgi:gamma-glutamyltranspeptidase/glutathione hydrolase
LHQRAGRPRKVGVEILKRGGSAVDAAIAANATLGLMEPVSNGIGGDLFAIVYSAKENKLYGINGSGRSPLGLSYDAMKSELAKLHSETIPAARHGCGAEWLNAACCGLDVQC